VKRGREKEEEKQASRLPAISAETKSVGKNILDSSALLTYIALVSNEPKTLQEAIRYFTDPDNCVSYIVARRWPDGVSCPTCGRKDVSYVPARRVWQCKTRHFKCQFSVKVGTVFEDSPLGLDKWLPAVWMLVNCKNGISSYEIHRGLGVTQKTAWFMLSRLRLALQDETGGMLSGQVEIDEIYIGAKARKPRTVDHCTVFNEKIVWHGPSFWVHTRTLPQEWFRTKALCGFFFLEAFP
jgi:hypothetical protein